MLAALIEKAQAKGEVRAGDPRLHAFTLDGADADGRDLARDAAAGRWRTARS